MSNEKEFDEWFHETFAGVMNNYLSKVFEEIASITWNHQQTKLDAKDKEIERLKKENIELSIMEEDAQKYAARIKKDDEKLKEQINNMGNFICPSFLSDDRGYVSCQNSDIERLKSDNEKLKKCMVRVIENQCENCNLEETILMCKTTLREVESE